MNSGSSDLGDLVLQVAVADVLVLAGLVLGPDDGRLVALVLQVPVHAVVAGVQAAAVVPAEIHVLVVVVEGDARLDEPGDVLGLLGPEGVRIVQGQAVQPLILFHAADVAVGGDFGIGSVSLTIMGIGHGWASG
jgi:hypothetical protein